MFTMTARLVFESALIELSKHNAPSLKLFEFNYYFNKAIYQYINKSYNWYDINLQATDDLRVLKATTYLLPQQYKGSQFNSSTNLSNNHNVLKDRFGATYEVFLPLDYLHLLNCVCIYRVNKTKDCYDEGSFIEIPATRLTADSWGSVITDLYNRPTPMRPYYYMHNVNSSIQLPTDKRTDHTTNTGLEEMGTDIKELYSEENSNFPRTFKLDGIDTSVVEKPIATRIGNSSNVRLEIRYGRDNSVFELVEVWVDYIKVPQHIRLTQEQIDLTEDTSQIMEFPDYVNLEIINELVHLVMERSADPRLGTNILMTLTIARPTQQLQPAQ